MKPVRWAVSLAILMSLAGCTGNFDIKQTEPLRIQIDGAPQETQVAADGRASERSEFKIESPDSVEVVKVVVEVKVVDAAGPAGSTSSAANTSGPNATQPTDGDDERAVVLVIVEDRDKKEKIAERRVESQGDATQVSLDVDVKGRDNVVIITQAVEGMADVNVAAKSSEAQAGSASPSVSATPTSATTSTYARP